MSPSWSRAAAAAIIAVTALAGCAQPKVEPRPQYTEIKRALVGRWQSEARTSRLEGGVMRLQGADGVVVGQELVFLPDGQVVIESQLEGAVDLDVATGTYDLLSPNLLAIVRYPRKSLGETLYQPEIRYTFYFDRGKLICSRDREKLVFRRVTSPDGILPEPESFAPAPAPEESERPVPSPAPAPDRTRVTQGEPASTTPPRDSGPPE